ncbi:MAG: sigma factor, partial [Chloroflexota bacterium]
PGRRGPAKGAMGGSERRAAAPGALGLRALAEQAERNRSDAEAQLRLLRRAAGGDTAAETRLFNEHLAMVIRLAGNHLDPTGAGLNEDELIQEGSIGLLSAIRAFPDSGAADFDTYATGEINAQMTAAQTEQVGIDRAAAQLVEDAEAYERAEISVRRDKGREATAAELAEKLEWTAERTARLGEMVREARRRHDEELLLYLDPDRLLAQPDEDENPA